jgi:hypothetical protein
LSLRALVLGPTGVVGDAIVREALIDRRIASIVAVSRRPLPHADPKLETAILKDFGNFEPLSRVLATVDFVLCALGISWYQTTGEAQYRTITHDYVMACARVAAIANPSMHFCFVSGHGASATSSQAWARIKAETEYDLAAVFGSRLTVFRVRPRRRVRLAPDGVPARVCLPALGAADAVLGGHADEAVDAVPIHVRQVDHRQRRSRARGPLLRHRRAYSEPRRQPDDRRRRRGVCEGPRRSCGGPRV